MASKSSSNRNSARSAKGVVFETSEWELDGKKGQLPALKVLGWDNRDTPLHLDLVAEELHSKLVWPDDERDNRAVSAAAKIVSTWNLDSGQMSRTSSK